MKFSRFNIVLSYFALILISYTKTSLSENSLKSKHNYRKKDEINDERVIGGRNAFNGERPYQVVLLMDGRFYCGGSLIKSNVVLTAAHCINGVDTRKISIRYNTLKRSIGPTIRVKRAIKHQAYSSSSLDNDIGVLILSSKIILDTNANTIKISKSGDPNPGSLVTVSGWGKTASDGSVSEDLKVANLNVVDRNNCGDFSSDDITKNMICATDSTSSSCNGDSGGPLTQDGVLVGIVSFGSRLCLDPRLPNVYTRVSNYFKWIEITLLKNGILL